MPTVFPNFGNQDPANPDAEKSTVNEGSAYALMKAAYDQRYRAVDPPMPLGPRVIVVDFDMSKYLKADRYKPNTFFNAGEMQDDVVQSNPGRAGP